MPPLIHDARAWTLAGLLLAGAPAHAFDPFLSPPGVAERGLAGAAVAGPGSLASVWHNPATLVDADTEATIEWQAAANRARDGDLGRGSNAWLLGAAFVNRDKWYGTAAIGAAAYTPHTKKIWVAQAGGASSAFGRANMTTQVIGVPYALEFSETGLAVGVVGEVVAVDPSGTDLRVQDAAGNVSEADFPGARQVGYSGALGLRQRVHDEGRDRVDVGAAYRFRATAGAGVDVDTRDAARLLPDKPGGYDLGVRWARDIGDGRTLAGHLQLGSTDWGVAGDMRRRAVAISLETPFEAWGVFRPGERVLRAGYARFRPDEAESWQDWPKGAALTGGISFRFDDGTRLDGVLERRVEERDEFAEQRAWFLGLAFSFPW
jgi:hypothetical protein